MRAVLITLILAVLTACTGAEDGGGQGEPGATPPQPSSTPTSTPVPIGCGGVIGGGKPGPEWKIVGDAVALPSLRRPALQAFPLAEGDAAMVDSDVVEPGWYWTKWGLVARGAHEIELAVPDKLIDDMRIGWGQFIEPAASTVMDCADTDGWLAFTGGYWVREPGCYALNVTVDTDPPQRVDIGIGASCAGQDPPPEPNG